ncbi:type II secretion system protein GspL [Deltaproteobacteria bacterium TL4]
MDNVFYTISSYPACVEGIKLRKHDNELSFDETYSLPDVGNAEHKIPLAVFLEAHSWKEQHVSVIVPTEKVTCRIINLPFQDKKKIKQILPFEIENEIMCHLDEVHYTYEVYPLADETSDVLLLVLDRSYLEALQQLFFEWEILLNNVECAAYVLFKSIPVTTNQPIFQIYIGADESFVNHIEGGNLKGVKFFPNRIPDLLAEYWNVFSVDLMTFAERFSLHDEEHQPEDPQQKKEFKLFWELKKEIYGLCKQFNIFLKTHHYYGDCKILLHGLFGTMLEWKGFEFQVCAFPFVEAQPHATPPPALTSPEHSQTPEGPESLAVQEGTSQKIDAPRMDKQQPLKEQVELGDKHEPTIVETPSSEHKEERPVDLSPPPQKAGALVSTNRQVIFSPLQGRSHWGILGDLHHYSLAHLEGGNLSFHSEGTPLYRFFRKYRNSAIWGSVLLVLVISISITNYVLRLKLIGQEMASLDRQIETTLNQLLGEESEGSVKAKIGLLQTKIQNRQQEIEVSKKFEKREYRHVTFLNKLSGVLEKEINFRIDMLEYNQKRFSISGVIESYDSLQLLKSGISKLDEFQNKQINEKNRNSSDGIIYTISLEL